MTYNTVVDAILNGSVVVVPSLTLFLLCVCRSVTFLGLGAFRSKHPDVVDCHDERTLIWAIDVIC